jgi:hypothetical protein
MGFFTFLLSLAGFMTVFYMDHWTFFFDTLHFKIGGIVANSMHNFAEMAWQTARLVLMKTVHGIFGFGLVLFA